MIYFTLVNFIEAEFGKLPAGAIARSEMGKTCEIILMLVFDPGIIIEKVPKNIRILTLEEMAKSGNEIDKYLKSHPEHKKWAYSYFEIIGTESLNIDDRTASFTGKGGMAVWYVPAEQRDHKDPRALGYQMIAMGTWLSDHTLAAYCRSKGWPWENGEIKYWEDESGLIHGHLKASDLDIKVTCKRQKPIKYQPEYPAYQTYWSPLPYTKTFEVVTYHGHQASTCSAQWHFKGSHPLIKAYQSQAKERALINNTEYAWDYVLKSALYSY